VAVAAWATAAASLMLVASPALVQAWQECTVGEAPINLDNGGSTAKLTGRVVCKDHDSGKIQREIPYVNGKLEGVEVMRTFEGNRLETTYRAGKKNGLERRYDGAGKLLEETHFVDDHELGEGRRFFPDGKVASRVVRREPEIETLRFEYDEAGHLVDLRCGSQVTLPIGRHPCHYERRTEVVRLFHPNGRPKELIPLVNGWREGKSERFAPDGKPVGMITFKGGKPWGLTEERTDSGQLVRRATFVDGELDGPEEKFFPDGKLAERAVYSHNRRQSLLRMWQNGQKRSMLTVKDAGKSELLEEFYDDGKPKSVEPSVRGGGRWGDGGPQRHGTVKRWWENGKPAAEETYEHGRLDGPSTSYFEDGTLKTSETWNDGRVTSRKQYDAHGTLLKDERYNEDGSRQ
jgi:antitoxin component YwqK of YwqJK toxin-antitoxin module